MCGRRVRPPRTLRDRARTRHMSTQLLSQLQERVGQEVHLSDWLTIRQQRIDAFADATSDHQWIHVDPARAAAESPWGSTIAHGYLTLSLYPMMRGLVASQPSIPACGRSSTHGSRSCAPERRQGRQPDPRAMCAQPRRGSRVRGADHRAGHLRDRRRDKACMHRAGHHAVVRLTHGHMSRRHRSAARAPL